MAIVHDLGTLGEVGRHRGEAHQAGWEWAGAGAAGTLKKRWNRPQLERENPTHNFVGLALCCPVGCHLTNPKGQIMDICSENLP